MQHQSELTSVSLSFFKPPILKGICKKKKEKKKKKFIIIIDITQLKTVGMLNLTAR